MIQHILGATLLYVTAAAAFAAEPFDVLPETYLAEHFPPAEGEVVKYARCKQRPFLSCSYVWGTPGSGDAMAEKYGVAPKGEKLMLTFAQGDSMADWDRVLASYTDAVPVSGLADKAVWSPKRLQLSLITGQFQIMHVHIDAASVADPRDRAIATANYLLERGLPL